MPLYEYKCGSCGYEFEELVSQKDEALTISCKICGGKADKQVSTFASVVENGSPNESDDMKIGREANKRWQSYHDRQSKRHGDRTLQNFDIPKAKDGTFMPVMALGKKEERVKRTEYVEALQDHRAERLKKGQSQFDGPGQF